MQLPEVLRVPLTVLHLHQATPVVAQQLSGRQFNHFLPFQETYQLKNNVRNGYQRHLELRRSDYIVWLFLTKFTGIHFYSNSAFASPLRRHNAPEP